MTNTLLGGWSRRAAVFAAILVGNALLQSVASAAPQGMAGSKDFVPPDLGPREPELLVDYPGGAATQSISQGTASVAVFVDADNKPKDILVISYSHPSFGKALADKAHDVTYRAAKYKDVPIGSRFRLNYSFIGDRSGNAMDEAANKLNRSDKLMYSPVQEKALDTPLKLTNPILPLIPPDYQPEPGVFLGARVTFFVDETGKARIPNVESVASPKLVPSLLKAVSMWQFNPPTVDGKPVLVLTGRNVTFMEKIPANAAPADHPAEAPAAAK